MFHDEAMQMYPRDRINALTDGVFAVAMTLLILDVRLPEEFQPHTQVDLLAALSGLTQKVALYALSFYVLGSTWLASTKVRATDRPLGKTFGFWWLLYLFLATCIPFSTTLVGRFAHLAPAVWVYAANLGLMAAVGYRTTMLQVGTRDDAHIHERRISLQILFFSSVLAILISFVWPSGALWAYSLNIAAAPLATWHFASQKERRDA